MPALYLRWHGQSWLFDCGEGTLRQLMKADVSGGPTDIGAIFITHMHGDHTFGLPSIVVYLNLCFQAQTDSLGLSKTKPLHIYGPQGLHNFLTTALQLTFVKLKLPIIVHEFRPKSPATNKVERAAEEWSKPWRTVEHAMIRQELIHQNPDGSYDLFQFRPRDRPFDLLRRPVADIFAGAPTR